MKRTGQRRSAGTEGKAPAKGRGAANGRRPAGGLPKPAEWQRLHEALREATDTLTAIRSGEVDAVVVSGVNGNQIYSLAGAEQPYRIYVERMQEGAVTVASDGLILYANQRFATMLGRPLERVISASLRAVLPALSWELLVGLFAKSDEVVTHETLLTTAQDEPLPVKITASRLPLDGQEMMCLVVTDLTAQKQHLELQLAKEVADRSNRAKDAFLAALSHELRTPLNPALLRVVAIEQDPELPERLRDDVELVRRNIELEARLIDDLLDLTRIAQGKLPLQLAPMDLHAAVRGAVEICEAGIRAKELQFRMSLQAGEARTIGDPVRVQQAVWNLLNNAAKFTPRGGRIAVTTRNPKAGGFEIEVCDTGVGFDPETAPMLFEAFEQGGSEVTRQFGGLGLGLAITRSIVVAHHGSVRAESPGPGRGASFFVTLPLETGAAEAIPASRAEPARPAEKRRVRILLVEDHRDTRVTMELLLRQSGYDVTSAGTAGEALALADRETFDLVITDLGLPDRSGLELMPELKARQPVRGIATSGYGMEDDIAKCRAAGFDEHLTKPIKLDQLRRVIRRLTADVA